MNLNESFSVAELKNGRYGVFDLREGDRRLCSCHISRSSAHAKKRELIQGQAREASTKVALDAGGFNEASMEQDQFSGMQQDVVGRKLEARQLRRMDIKSRLNKIRNKKEKLQARGV